MTDAAERSILFITIDSLRADHVGWHGYERDTTPFLDTLSEQVRTFSNAFSHAGRTPNSFPSILTSTYATMYGGGPKLSEKRTLVSEVLSEVGYTTAGFHSNPYLSDEYGYERGYDHYFDSLEEKSGTAQLRQLVKERLPTDNAVRRFLQRAFEFTERNTGIEVGSPFVEAEALTDRVLEWIESTGEPPHYCWVHYMDVHHPYIPPETYQRAFRDEPIGERRSVQLRRQMLEKPDRLDEQDRRDIVDLYDAEIRHTDAQVRRLVETVRRTWDNPVTIVTADHGEELYDHGNYSHHIAKFLDEHIHVPLLIDDGSGSASYEEIVGLIDLPPTIAEYASANVPSNYLGTSLHRLYEGDWSRDHVIAEWQDGSSGERNVGYRNHEWTYIYRENGHHPEYPEAEARELYYLPDDPGQTRNVASKHPDVVERLQAVVEAHIERVEATESDIQEVNVDAEVRQRLRDLGYQE